MTCEFCNAAVSIKTSEGSTTHGQFKEVYECANGHQGIVTGNAGHPPKSWRKSGMVFNG